MFTQKSISISIICDDGLYTATVNNDYYLNSGKDELPVVTQKDKIYKDTSIENIQHQVRSDFGVEIEDLFNWYWLI
jgi:hypothetical protein